MESCETRLHIIEQEELDFAGIIHKAKLLERAHEDAMGYDTIKTSKSTFGAATNRPDSGNTESSPPCLIRQGQRGQSDSDKEGETAASMKSQKSY